jgi:hypothetical protein
VPASKLVIWDS